METVYSHPCAVVMRDPESSVLRFVRTEVPYASAPDMIAIHAQAGRELDRLGRARHALLVDMRRAVLNNDPEFEKAAERARAILVRGFARVAVLVQTAVGALQVSRHVREDGLAIGVFSAEPKALDFLAQRSHADATPRSYVAVTGDGPFDHLASKGSRR